MKKFLCLVVGLLLVSQVAWGTTLISLPNEYVAGTTIKATDVNENEQHIQSQVNTHNAATTGEHGISGTIAGTSDTQTLTNKTLTSPTITTSPTAAGATWTSLGTVTTIDINGGTIDGATIGAASPTTGVFTTVNTGQGAYELYKMNQDVDTTATPSFTGATLTGDMTFGTGKKAIFGNAARYMIDNTDSYGIAFSTHVMLPPLAKWFFDNGGDTYMVESAPNLLDIYVGGSLRFRIDGANLTVYATTFYRSDNSAHFDVTSDIKLKENIKSLPSMIEKLKLLKPVNFTYKQDGKLGFLKGTKTGFIADDVETVFPEWVKTGSDGYKALNLDGIEAVLVSVIQEQQKQIDRQTLDINTLNDKIFDFEKRIAKLEGK